MAKCNRSSPSSFFIFRRRLTTALQGPHHCWYTSTTGRRERQCVRETHRGRMGDWCKQTICSYPNEHSGAAAYNKLQSQRTELNHTDYTHTAEQMLKCCNARYSLLKGHNNNCFTSDLFLPVKPLVARISSHCSWFVTDAWTRKKAN